VTIAEVKRALNEYGAWITCHPKLGYCLEIPESEQLLRIGWHHMGRHTREGLEKALLCFEQAAQVTGAEGRALEGVSRALLLMGAFSMRPPEQTYPRFLEAHRRVVELRGYTPELHADRGLGYHVFERNFVESEKHLKAAIAEQPRLAVAHVYMAMLYVSWQRFEEAEPFIRNARAADALLGNLALAEILARFCGRNFEAAVEYGKQVLDLHPYFPTATAFYAAALEKLGRNQEALELYRRVCLLSPEMGWNRALEGACLAKNGFRAEAEAALAEIERLRKTTYVDGYHTALLKHALGHVEEAMDEVEAAYAEGCPMLALLPVDPKFDAFLSHPRFEAIREKIAAPNRPVAA
jgi:tetratricopeptide (TPR) repeat protein